MLVTDLTRGIFWCVRAFCDLFADYIVVPVAYRGGELICWYFYILTNLVGAFVKYIYVPVIYVGKRLDESDQELVTETLLVVIWVMAIRSLLAEVHARRSAQVAPAAQVAG